MEEVRGYPIQPTATQATEQYSDIALTGLFNAHTAIVNSERQTIWQRYNVMLIANAIIFGFISGGTRTTAELILGAIFGMSLCIAWWIITVSGWYLFTARRDTAARFRWTGLDENSNPFIVGMAYERGTTGGRIYQVAIIVIALFLLMYLFLLLRQFFKS